MDVVAIESLKSYLVYGINGVEIAKVSPVQTCQRNLLKFLSNMIRLNNSGLY